jgi:hypothetical protein
MSWSMSSTALWMLYIVNTVKNDAEVEFRFEDLSGLSFEENAAFRVAEVSVARE